MIMSQSVTTSIRLPSELRESLEHVAHTLNRGKNWVVINALKEYLQKHNHESLIETARQQSLLASSYEQDDSVWEENIDDSSWSL